MRSSSARKSTGLTTWIGYLSERRSIASDTEPKRRTPIEHGRKQILRRFLSIGVYLKLGDALGVEVRRKDIQLAMLSFYMKSSVGDAHAVASRSQRDIT
jgi:hypothetical protein